MISGKDEWDKVSADRSTQPKQPTKSQTAHKGTENMTTQNKDAMARNAQEALMEFASVLGMSSMMASGRSIPVVTDIMKGLEKFKEDKSKSSINPQQAKTVPEEIISMDTNLSPVLPGIILARRVAQTMIIAPIMFSNRELANQLEEVHTNGILGPNMPSKVQFKMSSVRYMSAEVIRNIREGVLARFAESGIQSVQIITSRVIDLENYQSAENKERGLAEVITQVILDEWERGLKTTLIKTGIKLGIDMKSPFIDAKGAVDKNAYGHTKSATARIEGIKTQSGHPLMIDGVPSGANMSVALQTAPKEGQHYSTEASRSIVTAYATVQLLGVPFNVFASNQMSQQLPMFNPLAMQQQDGYPNGYRPLQAVVVLNTVAAQAQMGNNNGIASWLLGLYASMTVNHNHLFTEPLRMGQIGARGNLSHIERRIDSLIGGTMGKRDEKLKITEARLKDIDFTSAWIRRNINETASYAVDLTEFSNEASLHNFLLSIARESQGTETDNKQVILKMMDMITGGAATKLMEQNRAASKGWTIEKPILVPTLILNPTGTFKHNGVLHSLEEVDEIFLSRLCPTDDTPMVEYLRAVYGDNGQTPEAVRRYRISTMLQALLPDDVNITGTARRHYLSPEFIEFLGKCFDQLGALNASGTMGTFVSNVAVYAPGIEFAVRATAGAAGAYQMNSASYLGGVAVNFAG